MANLNISANNVSNVKFLRNGALYTGAEAAKNALLGFDYTSQQDGTAILARYSGKTDQQVTYYRTMVGFVFVSGNTKSVTILDVEGAQADVEALREEVRAKFGTGVTTDNSATDQFKALSGSTFTPGTSSSADTSVEGAKAYAYDLIGTLDYTDTAATGSYVSEVNQVDGKISVNRVVLPSSADSAVAKNVVIAVSEDKGQIEVTRGEISSSAGTIVLTDNADGGINFEVNIDNDTIVQDETSKKLKVASAALTQYVGDEDTIHISAVDSTTNTKTISSPLTISATTPSPSDTNVKEQYNLVGASGNTIGATIKIYKDSSVAEIYVGTNYDSVNTTTGVVDKKQIGDVVDEHTIVAEDFQYLNYVYEKSDGTYEMTKINLTSFLIEPEFKSGVTISNGVAHGVVDPQSEKDSENTAFLTVGADGFKISGIKDEIDRQLDAIVEGLDANVTASTSGNHVTITIDEVDGKLTQSGLTIQENDIASATDLAALSAKTVTALTSTNGSITADIDDAVGCKTYDIQTDADKIQMSGFSAENTSALSGIATSDSIATAFEKTNTVITDLDTRLDKVENEYISGITVNNTSVVTDHVGTIVVSGATSAMTPTSTEAIVVDTDTTTGAITLGIGTIDCGTY